jgi:hypothetical protein
MDSPYLLPSAAVCRFNARSATWTSEPVLLG